MQKYNDKKSLAVKLYSDDKSRKGLVKALSVPENTIDKWTSNMKNVTRKYLIYIYNSTFFPIIITKSS